MVVPTGTGTPWRELVTAEAEPDEAVFIKDGHDTGSADLLAEALRADGIVRSLGPAIRMAEDAHLEAGFYGYVDEDTDEMLCDENGETEDGEEVDEPRPCVIAYVNVSD